MDLFISNISDNYVDLKPSRYDRNIFDSSTYVYTKLRDSLDLERGITCYGKRVYYIEDNLSVEAKESIEIGNKFNNQIRGVMLKNYGWKWYTLARDSLEIKSAQIELLSKIYRATFSEMDIQVQDEAISNWCELLYK